MKLVLQTQLLPDVPNTFKLRTAVERFNEAANWLAGVAFEHKITRTFDLHKIAYRDLRDRFGLPADMACRCLAQVCDAYKRNKDKRPKFRKHAAVPYSMGKNIGFKGIDRVSISALDGRVVVPFVMGQYQADRFTLKKGQADLILRTDGKWFLVVTVDVPEGTPVPPTDFIGVDLGGSYMDVTRTATDIAYAAGFFDGEGSINIKKPGKTPKSSGHRLVVSVSQSKPAPLEWICERWGGGVRRLRRRHKAAWEWSVGSKLAGAFLQDLLPFLMVKREEAIVAIEFQSRKRNTGKTGCPENHLKDFESREMLHSLRVRAVVNPPLAAGTMLGNGCLVQATSRLL
jgi:predicted transposase